MVFKAAQSCTKLHKDNQRTSKFYLCGFYNIHAYMVIHCMTQFIHYRQAVLTWGWLAICAWLTN
jgi:hypothetical protein